MANLGNDNRFAAAFDQGAEQELRKSAVMLTKRLMLLEKRQTSGEEAILKAVKAIARRLVALEKGQPLQPDDSEPDWLKIAKKYAPPGSAEPCVSTPSVKAAVRAGR